MKGRKKGITCSNYLEIIKVTLGEKTSASDLPGGKQVSVHSSHGILFTDQRAVKTQFYLRQEWM